MKGKNIKTKKVKSKGGNAAKITAVQIQTQKKFDIFKLLDNEEFLRALKEKLETV